VIWILITKQGTIFLTDNNFSYLIVIPMNNR
jgi:hypothetical protein